MARQPLDAMEYQAGLSAEEVRGRAGGHSITKLSSNENPFGPSPLAIAAAQVALGRAHLYPERDDAKLCAALAAFHSEGLTAGNFFAANSGVEVLSLIEDATIQPGERAIICPPCFGAYAASLARKQAMIDMVWLDPEYMPQVDAILAAVRPETRLVYLCNPNNPTGTWFAEDVLSDLLDGLPDHVTVIYDEVYYQFATGDGLPDAIAHVRADRNLVIVHSFSKAYGLAGLRLGYGIAPDRIVAAVQARKRSFHVNSVGMAAAQAALDDTDHLARTVDNNHNERARVHAAMRSLGLEVTPSQANFVMFRAPEGLDAAGVTARLIAGGIMVRPAFNLPDHVRCTIGTPDDNARLLAALASIMKG